MSKKQKIDNLVKFIDVNDEIMGKLFRLKYRWLDEREYEDFEDYKKEIKKIFENTIYVILKITKGFKITLTERHSSIDLNLTILTNKWRITF